jgi:hypothetical protein
MSIGKVGPTNGTNGSTVAKTFKSNVGELGVQLKAPGDVGKQLHANMGKYLDKFAQGIGLEVKAKQDKLTSGPKQESFSLDVSADISLRGGLFLNYEMVHTGPHSLRPEPKSLEVIVRNLNEFAKTPAEQKVAMDSVVAALTDAGLTVGSPVIKDGALVAKGFWQ